MEVVVNTQDYLFFGCNNGNLSFFKGISSVRVLSEELSISVKISVGVVNHGDDNRSADTLQF